MTRAEAAYETYQALFRDGLVPTEVLPPDDDPQYAEMLYRAIQRALSSYMGSLSGMYLGPGFRVPESIQKASDHNDEYAGYGSAYDHTPGSSDWRKFAAWWTGMKLRVDAARKGEQ